MGGAIREPRRARGHAPDGRRSAVSKGRPAACSPSSASIPSGEIRDWTANAAECLNRISRAHVGWQPVPPPMLMWMLSVSGRMPMRKVGGWETPSRPVKQVP